MLMHILIYAYSYTRPHTQTHTLVTPRAIHPLQQELEMRERDLREGTGPYPAPILHNTHGGGEEEEEEDTNGGVA